MYRHAVNPDVLHRQIRAAQERIESLKGRAGGSQDRQHAALLEAFEEFSTTIEELNVAETELRNQADELLETRAEVEAERQRHRDLFDFAPDGYLVTDLNGVIREANVAAANMLGTTQRYMVPKPVVVFVADDARPAFRSFLSGLPAKEREEEWETRMRPHVGETFHCALTVTAIRDADGGPTGLRWLLRDVTARKRIEAQLRLLNAELEIRVRERTADLLAAARKKDAVMRREQAMRARAEAAQRDLSFLSDAGAVLSESLDYAATLTRVAHLAVSHFADWCAVVMVEDGEPLTVAIAHRDPGKAEVAAELQRHCAPSQGAIAGVARVIQTGEAELHTEVRESLMQSTTQCSRHREILRSLGITSAIFAPMIARGETIGAIAFVSSSDAKLYQQDDLALANELARRAAQGVDNARLYRRAQAELAERANAEAQLAESLREIEALNERLRRSMVETHHRVKNNLQMIAAMIDMQMMDRPATIPAGYVERLNRQIRLLARLHELLTVEAGRGELEAVSAQEVIEKVLAMVQNQAQSRTITMELTNIDLDVRKATALALVVNELVSNAIKHSDGEIRVTLEVGSREGTEQGAGPPEVRLFVSDEGPGFPASFDPRADSNTGLELVESLSRWDLQGETRYENGPEGGARVAVRFAA